MKQLALSVAALAIAMSPSPLLAEDHSEPATAERQKVLGIGGFFFRSDDPRALAAWYEKHLGINPVPTSYEQQPWQQEAGPTVFAPFKRSSEGMGKPGKEWVMNLRVRDMDAMVAQLRADGIDVELDPTTYPNGRFAELVDPEGNPIQLWQEMKPE